MRWYNKQPIYDKQIHLIATIRLSKAYQFRCWCIVAKTMTIKVLNLAFSDHWHPILLYGWILVSQIKEGQAWVEYLSLPRVWNALL